MLGRSIFTLAVFVVLGASGVMTADALAANTSIIWQRHPISPSYLSTTKLWLLHKNTYMPAVSGDGGGQPPCKTCLNPQPLPPDHGN